MKGKRRVSAQKSKKRFLVQLCKMKSLVSIALRALVVLSVIVGQSNGQVKPSAFGKLKPPPDATASDSAKSTEARTYAVLPSSSTSRHIPN